MDEHVNEFIQGTRHADVEILKQSASELGRCNLGSHRHEAIQALCDLLDHPQLDVRETAKQTLIQIRGNDVVTSLVSCLSSSSTTVLNYVIEILGQIGTDGIDLLITLLESKDHDIRKFGCDILGNLKHQESVYELIELLNDPHINVAIAAVEALGKLGNPEAVPHLIRTLQHPDAWMKCIAAEALGKIGDSRAVDAFLRIPPHEEPIVLYSVIKAMGNLHDQRVIPYILSVLRANDMFASSVVQALEHLEREQGDSIYEEIKMSRVTAPFVRLLASEHLDVLRTTIRIVGKLHLEEAIQPLQKLLHHTNETIVLEAIEALMQLEAPESLAQTFELLLKETTETSRKQLFQQVLSQLMEE